MLPFTLKTAKNNMMNFFDYNLHIVKRLPLSKNSNRVRVYNNFNKKENQKFPTFEIILSSLIGDAK